MLAEPAPTVAFEPGFAESGIGLHSQLPGGGVCQPGSGAQRVEKAGVTPF